MFLVPPSIDLGNPVSDDPLCRGLVSWWMGLSNNSNGKTLFDLTGRNPGTLTNMTLVGSATSGWRPPTRPGAVGPCLGFDSASTTSVQVGNVATLSFTTASPFTLSCWTKSSTASDMIFLSKELNSGTFAGYYMVTKGSNGVLRLFVQNSSAFIEVDGATNVLDGAWHHCTATYDGSGVAAGCKLYVDGKPESQTTVSDNLAGASIVSTAPFVLGGRDSPPAVRYTGLMDDAAVHARALSASEVFAVYADGLAGHPRMLRRCKRRVAGAVTGNRRRRVLICGGSR